MDPSCQTAPGEDPSPTQPPQLAVLDFFFPGFSMLSGAIQKYLHIDLNLYIPLILLLGGLAVSWRYFSEYFWDQLETHFMSHVDCPTNDDSYNFLMNWVAGQSFAKRARRFMVNTNLNSRSWFVWSWESDDDEDAEYDDPNEQQRKKKALQYTPTFGSHYFWYRGRLLIFRRTQSQNRSGFVSASEKEEISVSCFGRNPWVLKELLLEARTDYLKKDESKTLIYRGTTRSGSTDPTWQRCMARSSRPLSTVILNDKVKTELIDDITDYLNPATRRWYANRGIPYRRGYLLHGPPGTGKSSLSLALAGFFKMRIYIVSLNSITANEENLASLFAELPRRCVVLLEDIDTAGLTHTREDGKPAPVDTSPGDDMVPGQVTPGNSSATNNDGNNNNNNNGNNNPVNGRLSLSGLLNILDGVASQEGRVLVMTTNHLEKLDKALIRPGRVDMIVKFDLADRGMTTSIFRAIFAPLEGDDEIPVSSDNKRPFDPEADQQKEAEAAKKKDEIIARVNRLADEFADKIPAHEFSPAELQGYLLKNKRNAETAVENADQWVIDTRKEKKEKLLKEAEERRKKEEEEAKKKEEEEKKKKEEEEKKKKEEEEKRKKEEEDKKKEAKKQRRDKSRRRKGRKGRRSSDSERDSSSESDSESDAEEKEKRQKRNHGSEEGKSRKAEPKAEPEAKERQDTRQAETTITVDEADGKTTAVKELAEEGKHGGDSGYGTP